MILLQNGPAFL